MAEKPKPQKELDAIRGSGWIQVAEAAAAGIGTGAGAVGTQKLIDSASKLKDKVKK